MAGTSALYIAAIAAAGYLFTDKCLRYRYILPRDDGQRLYLRVVTYGIPFLVFTILLTKLLFWLPTVFAVPVLVVVEKGEKPVYIAFGTVVIAWGAAWIYNLFLSPDKTTELFAQAMRKDDFDSILWNSMSTFRPIAVSLQSRKVYVGLVANGLEPTEESSYLTILPLLSGYRDKDTLQFNISASYDVVLNTLSKLGEQGIDFESLEAYYMAFPRDTIISLHLYNDHLYQSVSAQYSSSTSVAD